jgi:hypothetical protein
LKSDEAARFFYAARLLLDPEFRQLVESAGEEIPFSEPCFQPRSQEVPNQVPEQQLQPANFCTPPPEQQIHPANFCTPPRKRAKPASFDNDEDDLGVAPLVEDEEASQRE